MVRYASRALPVLTEDQHAGSETLGMLQDTDRIASHDQASTSAITIIHGKPFSRRNSTFQVPRLLRCLCQVAQYKFVWQAPYEPSPSWHSFHLLQLLVVLQLLLHLYSPLETHSRSVCLYS